MIKYESPSGGLHTQLFNLKDNPHEFIDDHHIASVSQVLPGVPQPSQKNLADDGLYADRREDMEALLLSEMERLHDPYRFSDQRKE